MKHFGQLFALAAGMLFMAASAQAQDNPPANAGKPPVPILRLDSDGPVSQITSLAFSPDAKTLYAGGWDKAVYVWTWNDNAEQFEFAPTKALRIPIGPDMSGAINAMAISADGKYLAVGGRAYGKRFTDFKSGGLIFPADTQSDNDRRDTGTIYVFDLSQPGQPQISHLLRGHLGTILYLTFAPSSGEQSPVLVSAAQETKDGKSFGAIRVWDLNQPKESVAVYTDLVAPKDAKDSNNKLWQPPRAVTALRTGNGAKDVLVGIAWGENTFRVWNAANGSVINVTNHYSFVCAEVENQFLLAGGYRLGPKGQGWHLGLWKPPIAESAQQPSIVASPFQGSSFPVGVAKASNAPVLLTVARDPQGKMGFFLADAQSLSRLPATANDRVFGDQGMRPAFAISGDGTKVAVAGNVDRTIQVFAVDAAALGNPQILTTQGEYFPLVRFFKNGESLGLGLDRDANAQSPDDLIFDLTGGQIAANKEGWLPAPANAGITAKAGEQNGRRTVIVDRGQGQPSTIILGEDESFIESQIALCPKTDNHPPLVGLIVVSPKFSEPTLRVYNAETGGRLRQFSGHSDAITSIAFSDDGKLLASAGKDRTVRVWWMEDLKSHIGRHGFLEGLVLSDIQGKATVTKIDALAAADVKNALQINDVIEGFTGPGGVFQPTPKSFPFFYHLSTIPVVSDDNNQANKIALSIVRNGQKLANAEVQVQQGVDERKPLFTLFFQGGQAGQPASWIGWTPLGPFDSSDQAIETSVGWHFNPHVTNPDGLSSYATLSEYGKDHRTKGMFKSLIETGAIAEPEPVKPAVSVVVPPKKIPVVLPPAPPVPPAVSERFVRMSLSLYETAGEGLERQITILKSDAQKRAWTMTTSLIATLSVRGMPPTEVRDKLVWMLDNQKVQATVIETSPGRFEADLSQYAWKPKANNEPYFLEVSLTDEGIEVEPVQQAIVFAPPPPPPPPPQKILPNPTIISPDTVTVLYDQYHQPQIEVVVDLSPDGEAPVLAGRLTFERNGKPLEKAGQVLVREFDETTGEIKETLPLENGDNLLQVKIEAKEGTQTKVSNQAAVSYRRLPQVKSALAKADPQKPRADITAEVVTPLDREIQDYKIYVNEESYTFLPNQVEAVQDETDKTLWKVTVKNVPLSEGENTIRVVPRNADGRVIATPSITAAWKKPEEMVKPLPVKPRVQFANVDSQVPLAGYWQGQDYPVEFSVLAPGKLARLLINYNGERIDSPAIPEPTDGSEYKFQLPLSLAVQQNKLQITAVDENARWDQGTVTLAPLKPPLTLKIDSLEIRGRNLSLAPVSPDSQTVTFPPAPYGRVVLRGRITTASSTMTFERPFVKCWVNGSLFQALATQNPESPTEWNYALNVCLNRKKGNTFFLELPEGPETPFSQTRGFVDCEEPVTRQTLRMLLVGFDPKALRAMDKAALRKQAEAAVQGAAFHRIEYYSLEYPGEVRSQEIMAKLIAIDKESQTEATQGEHVVVMVYYRGKEVLNPKGQLVLMTHDKIADRSVLTDQRLIAELNETPGAHLVLLDLEKDKPLEGQWKSEPFLGVVKSTTNGNAGNPTPLLAGLQKALPQTGTLDELPGNIQQALGQDVEGSVPNDLKQIVIGPKKP